MLRITPNKSASGAVRYFDDGLSKSDYYAEKGEIIGKWGGEAAKRLGLSGEVKREQFESLCYNTDPSNSEQLTARNNDNRRVGYDFTYSVPKSVSIIYGQTKDKEILNAFHNAIDETMKNIESEAQTRVRIGGKSEDRTTGNLVWGTFTHDDARPVNGIPDPHLHQHVFVFNATYDDVENKWKAAQFGNIKADGQYFETLFHSRLAENLTKIGYQIERNNRDFEIKGFERATIDKFSNRTLEINKKADKLGLNYPEDKAELGAKTRENKREGYDKEDIRLQWRSRLNEKELELIHSAKNSGGNGGGGTGGPGFDHPVEKKKEINAKQAVQFALSHSLERKSVVSEKELFIHGLKRSFGSVSPSGFSKELNSRKDLFSKKENDRNTIYTTQEAINEEKRLRDSTRKGRNSFASINPDYRIKNEMLNDEQKNAVWHVLKSKDFITMVSGDAGVGKTWSIKEVAQGIKERGLNFGAFAPSSVASRQVQRDEGFKNATTISELLQSDRLQNSVKNGVIWIDEAGMVGSKTMNRIIDIAKQQSARILLTGDIKQHGAVERGDALRVIEQFGGAKPARISKIQRQKVADYRKAVKSISDGNLEKGIFTLDAMGAIKEATDLTQLRKNIALEYVSAIKDKEEILVVATTHVQGKAVTEDIREGLKKAGILKGQERLFKTMKNLSFTEAQKADSANYEEGMTVQFHQNCKGGIKRGTKYHILGKDEKGNVRLADEKKKEEFNLPLKEGKKFSVYHNEQTSLAEGDKIRITQNGFSDEKKRLNNGNILTITGFDKKGNILAFSGKNNITLNKDYGNFTHGYYTTSPASQGKSVNRVIIMQGSVSGKAASKEQFYVSASRGKFAISIHTDDKESLVRNVARSSQRMMASEMAKTGSQLEKSMKDKLKVIGAIYRANKSMVANFNQRWQDGKSKIINIISKLPKPIIHAPSRAK